MMLKNALFSMMFMISVASIAQKSQLGKASYYADDFEGKATASGEIFHQDSLFAAHKTLPFGTIVIVTNRANHKSVRVKINDRGPHVPGRIIDLSRAAMQKIDGLKQGVIEVEISLVGSR